MQTYQLFEKQLSESLNELELLDLYRQTSNPVHKIQVLSRLKKVLLQIPNEIETHPTYLKECNDRYYCLIFDEIANSSKRQKIPSLKFLYHVVSLRIKFWFLKKDFDNLFNLFMLNIEHNKMIIPSLVEFLIELIDTFQNHHLAQSQSIDKKNLLKYNLQANSRHSLTRKTNNSLFSNDMITRKTCKATKELNQSLNRKCCFRKENKFQREFVDFQLNKFLIFANEVFNRAVVQNPNYDIQDDNSDQEEPLYLIKMSHTSILKTLQLIHKILTYDFFGDRKNIQNEDFTEKMPLIIPTKYSKLAQFHQFQNWIKNKNDFYRYQYLYFTTNIVELKIYVIKIFGDLLRIHQKFFKKETFFKTHVENVLGPIKGFLENLEIKQSQDFDLAITFGESINKLLTNSVFPTFLNMCGADFKKGFIDSVDEFIQKELLSQQLLDVTLVRYFVGFFVQILEKLNINSSGQSRIMDFKEDIQSSIFRMGEVYEEILYKQINGDKFREQFPYFIGFEDAVDHLNLQYFKEFFNIFKFFTPRTQISQANDLRSKCKNLCSRIQCCVYQFESLCRWDKLTVNEHKKKQTFQRHLLQCFNRLIELVADTELDASIELMLSFKFKLLLVSFIGEKFLNSKYHLTFIFDSTDHMHRFTKVILQLVSKIKLQNFKQQQCLKTHSDDANTVYQYSLQLLVLAVKLNEKILSEKTKVFVDMEKINEMKQKLSSKLSNEKYEGQLEENLKNECQSTCRELQFFEDLVRQVKQCFTKEMNVFAIEESSSEKISLKALYLSISEKEFQAVLQPIYKLYFVALQKYELHRRKHEKMTAKNQRQQKVNNQQMEIGQISQDQTVEQWAKNDDQCSVIEEDEQFQDFVFNTKLRHLCSSQIDSHDLNEDLNPIAYFVYLQLINESESLNTELLVNYKHILKRTKTIEQQQTKTQIDISSYKKRSYYQIYDISTILSRLEKEYFGFTSNEQNPIIVEVKYYILKIVTQLLKIFKQGRYEADAKKMLIDCVFDFGSRQFEDILRSNYRLEVATEEMEEDLLMASRTQTLIGLLEGLISVHFSQQRTNLYNLEFLILFPTQQHEQAQKIQNIKENQKLQILQIFNSTQRISILFSTVLNFIMSFPQLYLQNGFYPLAETQLIRLIRQIYFEFSQFITIYLFGLSTNNWIEGLLDMLNIHKVLIEEESSVFQKYAVSINHENLPCVIWAHTVLLKYVQKVLQLSFHSDRKDWLQIRNKEILPFLKQLILFFRRLSKEPQIMKIAFELDFVDQKMNGSCYFPSVVRKFYDTIFEFLRYFLGKFQNLSIEFITEHLSFIECIYEMVEIGRSIHILEVDLFIEGEISTLDEIKLFKYVPGVEKKSSRKSNIIQEKCKQYRGWQYIARLALSDSTTILEELEAYEMKFKYYVDCEPRYSETVTVKESSQQISSGKDMKMSGRKSKQIIQSIKKKSPLLKPQNNWSDVEEDLDENDPQTLGSTNKINTLKKVLGISPSFDEDQNPSNDFWQDVADNQPMEIERDATDIEGPDSLYVNLDSVDDSERLNNLSELQRLDDLNDEELFDINTSHLSPAEKLSLNNNKNLDNELSSQQHNLPFRQKPSSDQLKDNMEKFSQQVNSEELELQSPNKRRVIQDDEMTTYDLLQSKDYMISPIKDNYEGLDPIVEESQRNPDSFSQRYSRKAQDQQILVPESDKKQRQKQFEDKIQPIAHHLSPRHHLYNNSSTNMNPTEPSNPHELKHQSMNFYSHNHSSRSQSEVKGYLNQSEQQQALDFSDKKGKLDHN